MRGMAAGYGRRFGEVLQEVSRLVEQESFHLWEYFRPLEGLPRRKTIASASLENGRKTDHSWSALTPGHGLDLKVSPSSLLARVAPTFRSASH
jgi:hypothetical protein